MKSLERVRQSNLPFIALLLLILILPPILGAWLGLRHAASTEEIATVPTPGAPAVPSAEPVAVKSPELLAPPEVVVTFNKGGCGNCHVIPGVPGANGQVGPDLSDLGAEAAERRLGISTDEYIRESIQGPNAFIVLTVPAATVPRT